MGNKTSRKWLSACFLCIFSLGLTANAQWINYNRNQKKDDDYILDIDQFKKLGKDDHVVQFQQGEYLYTLVPVKDHVLNEKRREIFSATVDFGKLVLKEWIMQAASVRGLIESETDIKAIEAAIEMLETKSDGEIRRMFKDGEIPKMPNSIEIVKRARQIKDVMDQKKAKKKYIDEIDQTLVELEEHGEQIVLEDGRKVNWMEMAAPSAFIVSFGFKIPKAKLDGLQAGIATGGVAGFAYRGIYLLGKLFSGNTATVTIIMRPWLQHVRHLNSNEIYVSAPSKPSTWHLEPSVQVWVAKDANKAKEAGQGFKPSFRAGLGLLWGQIDSLREISGMFTGPSWTFKTPLSIMGANTSVNIKGGVIVPVKGLKASELWSIFKYRYIIVSPQVGIPLTANKSKQWNLGFIMNLTDFLNVPVFNPGPIRKQPGIIIRPGQPVPPSRPMPGLNPPVGFQPGGRRAL